MLALTADERVCESAGMIEFATLLLGIVTGLHPVSVMVDETRVASVELRLDGRVVAPAIAAPWRVECDFGAEIRPHVLEAVALAADRRELGRASQWVNLPRQRAEVALLVQRDGKGGATAKLAWSSAIHSPAKSVRVSLDETPLDVRDPAAIPLPAEVREGIHLLHAEVAFADGRIARTDVAVGGGYFDRSAGELTAVPFVPTGKAALPEPEGMAGWFSCEGERILPTAVEKGRAEVVLVVSASTAERFRVASVLWGPAAFHRTILPGLGDDTSVRVVVPAPEASAVAGGAASRLFPLSQPLRPGEATPLLLSVAAADAASRRDRQQLAAAVALAGIEACASGQRRVVVLLLGHRADDDQEARTAEVQKFLADLHVPLVVWALSDQPRPAAAWPARLLTAPAQIHDLARHVETILDSQRIVWLSGRHLPYRIELSPAASERGRLAG